ncbi:MAG TPA: hypothetical protein VKE40_23355 [Gemmataceae bacterium]|nr:hypothetical protein [Gemmataceae bacterium]
MNVVTGIVRDGHVELDTPTAFPNGTRVRVQPDHDDVEDDEQHPWPTTMEGIEAMIRELEVIEPAILTAEEEAQIAANRKAMKAKGIESMRKRMGLDK